MKFKTPVLNLTLYDYSNTFICKKGNLPNRYRAMNTCSIFCRGRSYQMIEPTELASFYRLNIRIKYNQTNDVKYFDALISVYLSLKYSDKYETIYLN